MTAALGGPLAPEAAALIAECLPEVEAAVVSSLRKDDDE